nr:hypothetical protein MOAAAGMB_00078 [Gallid alphaherpesvirus 2]WOL21667.1 hypothetical protein BMMJLCPH_00092 [Gallid alphaherpesvirus 2]WOL21782.1 hypothetical protein DMEEGDKK_00096 [Gallid alphaherpesvirus 2]
MRRPLTAVRMRPLHTKRMRSPKRMRRPLTAVRMRPLHTKRMRRPITQNKQAP